MINYSSHRVWGSTNAVLGPVFFSIYINKLCETDFNGKVINFVDGMVLLFSGLNWEVAKSNVGLRNVKLGPDLILTLNCGNSHFVSFLPYKDNLHSIVFSYIDVHVFNCLLK